jgi:hypothetical protein
VKIVLGLAIVLTSAVWADEAADRAAIEATLSALNTSPTPAAIFTADFPNAAELQRVREEARLASPQPLPQQGPAQGRTIQTPAGTIVVSNAPMGEATWYPAPGTAFARRFVTRSVTFVGADTAVVVAALGPQPVLFVVKREGTDWRIASFRVLPEARTNVL